MSTTHPADLTARRHACPRCAQADADRAALAVAQADNAILRRSLAAASRDLAAACQERDALLRERRGPSFWETPLFTLYALWDRLDSLHRQVWACAAIVLLVGYVAACIVGGWR